MFRETQVKANRNDQGKELSQFSPAKNRSSEGDCPEPTATGKRPAVVQLTSVQLKTVSSGAENTNVFWQFEITVQL